MVALEPVAALLAVVPKAQPLPKGGQLQHRHVEPAAVEGDQLRLFVHADAEPELADDLLGPEEWGVETGDRLEREIVADLDDADGHRDLEGDVDEVRAGLGRLAG